MLSDNFKADDYNFVSVPAEFKITNLLSAGHDKLISIRTYAKNVYNELTSSIKMIGFKKMSKF